MNGLRDYRIFNMAIFDLVATFIFVLIIHTIMWRNPLNMKKPNERTWVQYIISLILLYISFIGLGVIIHRIFRIESALSAYLGFNDKPNR